MALEVIETITQVEAEGKAQKAAAENEGRKLKTDAQNAGQALLESVRQEAARHEKDLLRQAEERAALRSAQIARSAGEEAAALRAGAKLSEAVEFIVGRIVSE